MENRNLWDADITVLDWDEMDPPPTKYEIIASFFEQSMFTIVDNPDADDDNLVALVVGAMCLGLELGIEHHFDSEILRAELQTLDQYRPGLSSGILFAFTRLANMPKE